MHTLIIGSGMAGITLAREIRKLDRERPLTVVTADDGSFYSKPNLSNAFAAGKRPQDLVMTPAERLEQDLGLRILRHCPVEAIDAGRRTVRSAQGELAYDQLVLAVGASQVRLPLAGDAADAVLTVNSLDDYAALRRRLDGCRRVAIVGAGLIGCEFANDLRLGGFAVDLFDIAPLPLARLLPEAAATLLRDRLAGIGVGFHLATALRSIDRDGEGFRLTTGDGAVNRYDLVISAVGLKPNLALARSAGLATGIGIRTDAFLRTSDPDIYALGDCIEIAGHYLPYVMPIMHGARKLAATLAGRPEPLGLPAMPVVLKTPACPTVVSPPPAGPGRWEATPADDGLRALYVDAASGEASGFVLQGACTRERMALAGRMPALVVA